MMISEGPIGDKNESVLELAVKLEQFVRDAAAEGRSLHEVEQKTLGTVLELGKRYVDLFGELQGDGDLGVTVTTEEGQELRRSEEPTPILGFVTSGPRGKGFAYEDHAK